MKLIYKEKFKNKRIIHVLGLKITYKKRIKLNFRKKLNEIKKVKRKIIVFFLVNEIAKWKTDSLYNYMSKSDYFEPYIVITIADAQLIYSKEKRIKSFFATKNYFNSKNYRCIDAYNPDSDTCIDLKFFDFDIIFYQQPWGLNEFQDSPYVSQFALTCYVPYYVFNYGDKSLDVGLDFHQYLWKYYVLNEEWKKFYSDNHLNLVPVGHTMLDCIYLNKNKDISENKYLIYAPHWSIPHPNNTNPVNFATFMQNGFNILHYAQAHKELNWVFKPHPDLKLALSRVGYSDDEIERYYNAWEEIGMCCYDSSYMELFMKSKALITDCGSFCTEYFCTGKPLLHLISEKCTIYPKEPAKKIMDLHYQIHDFNQLKDSIQTIVINNNDYLKEKRLNVLKNINLIDNYAAANIVKDLLVSTKINTKTQIHNIDFEGGTK